MAPNEQLTLVKSLSKQYTAVTQKLLYAFAAISEQSESATSNTVSAAVASNARVEAMEVIATALSAGVEKVIRSNDVSLRSRTMRDLRSRFITEKPKTAEQATQADINPAPATVAEVAPEAIGMDWTSEVDADAAAPDAAAPDAAAPDAAVPCDDAPAAGAPAGAAANFAMYERLKLWEARKAARLEGERKKKEEEEAAALVAPPKRRSSLKYAHVVSAVRAEREGEDAKKLAAAEQRALEEAEAREAAEEQLAAHRQEAARISERMVWAEQARLQAEEELRAAKAQIEQERRTAERLRAENEKSEEVREMLQALDGRTLEAWPMVPGRKVLRVHDSNEFDGRVSAEYRVKDVQGGERGVSLLMGRSVATRQPEVQCVLFDPAVFSDIECARWWANNRYRLEKQVLRGKPTARAA